MVIINECDVTVAAIRLLEKEGYEIIYISEMGMWWSYGYLFPHIKIKPKRGGFDLIIKSPTNELIGIEIKNTLRPLEFETALGQCIHKISQGLANKATIMHYDKTRDTKSYLDSIKKFNLPIELRYIDFDCAALQKEARELTHKRVMEYESGITSNL